MIVRWIANFSEPKHNFSMNLNEMTGGKPEVPPLGFSLNVSLALLLGDLLSCLC